MTLRLLVLLFGLAACAAEPPPPAAPVVDDPNPSSRLARAAVAEWQAWGRIVVEGWPFERPADTAATPERFGRLLGYWAEVPGGRGVAARLVALQAGVTAPVTLATADVEDSGATPVAVTASAPEDIGLYAYPAWSAAFISAMARRAGLPWQDLPSSGRHARYIDALLARAATDPEGAAFLPFAPEERAPRPGDLLCMDRSWSPLTHWSRRLADRGRPRPMHCDVVVRTRPGVVEVIGGNVQDMVVLRRFPADDTGRVLPAPEGRPPFVLLLAGRDEEE